MQTQQPDLESVLAVFHSQRHSLAEQLRIAQQLIEVLPIPVFFKGRDGRYLGVNRAWEEFFGMRRDDMVGAAVKDLYPGFPAIAARHQAMDEDLWANPGAQSYEIPVTTRDGRLRHTLYYKATFGPVESRPVGLIGTIIDITDRKRAELREAIEHAVSRHMGSDQPLHEAIRGILEVMCERLDWACGARWSLDERNNRLYRVETWSRPDEAIQAFLDASSQATFVPGRSGLIREVLATGSSVWIADVTQKPDFLRAELARAAGLRAAFALPVLMGERVLGAMEFFSRDVRQQDPWLLNVTLAVGQQIGQLMLRRQAEAAMRKSEARFRSLTALSSDWYWEQDAELRFTEISGGAVAEGSDRFLGKRRWETDMVGVSAQALDAHRALLAQRKPFRDFEFGRRDADGLHWVSVSGEPVFDEGGAFRGYRGVGRDITRRRNNESQLREAHDMLEVKARELTRSNEELQQFAYVASHDLQEPLRMISSYTQLLARRYGDRLDGDAREFMDFIVDGAARMKQLIEDLLEYSRVGTRGRDLEPTDSSAALAKALSNLRKAQEESGARVTSGEMPRVVADANQLTQLFQNLVANAIKFRGVDAPRIHVAGESRGDSWAFTVKDNGIGLDTQYADRIFMMFQRLHNKAEYPGTGIGLAICKKIVERHGGRIWVESTPGAGCTFGFTLARNHKEKAT
ncbi:MAG TPA: ATP-binding protein [Usitatibacter sp.]|nr:ATP-binding protein [Usitatibacter sp.]